MNNDHSFTIRARALLLAMLCMLCGVVSFAQSKQFTLTGTMEMSTGEKFPYKVVFAEDNGMVKGCSYTFSEPQETKSVIKGTLDRYAHTLVFKETEIVSSQGVRTKAFMCLADARLEYVKNYKGNRLEGPMTTRQTDRTSCTPGTIVFNNEEELKQLFASQEKFDTVISMKRRKAPEPVIAETAPAIVQEVPVMTEKVTAGIEKSYEWHSDTVIIDVWDGGNTDGDRITLQFDDKPVLTQYFLIKERKQLRIPLPAIGVHTLTILADNEGSDPPNTATMLLTDGSKRYSIVAYNTKGQKAMIRIKRVK